MVRACALYAFQSGRQDLNLRPPGPQPGALPDCATPRGVRPFYGPPAALSAFDANICSCPTSKPLNAAAAGAASSRPSRISPGGGSTLGSATTTAVGVAPRTNRSTTRST